MPEWMDNLLRRGRQPIRRLPYNPRDYCTEITSQNHPQLAAAYTHLCQINGIFPIPGLFMDEKTEYGKEGLFARPGHPWDVAFSQGYMKLLPRTEELVAILAHETAHLYLQHIYVGDAVKTEREADQLGALMLDKAGIGRQALISALTKATEFEMRGLSPQDRAAKEGAIAKSHGSLKKRIAWINGDCSAVRKKFEAIQRDDPFLAWNNAVAAANRPTMQI